MKIGTTEPRPSLSLFKQKCTFQSNMINSASTVVEEAIEGIVGSHPGISRIEGWNVLVRSDCVSCRDAQVALISGGGSGHEPAHGGFIGPGMLSAAICGGVFASPSVDSILTGIRTVTGSKGLLLIVKNYTGDRLNFGLAAEQAKTEGYNVAMVIVGDDVAVNAGEESDGTITGRRGLAGTLFVHKVAGAAAAAGASLEQVLREALFGIKQGHVEVTCIKVFGELQLVL